ncbi:MAG TPA: SDR family NAD(P)-dependent oxidoreductase [Steroidobacteraceae bacterium]|nr:SDR family NAD(P)-dependent oxidoreductase [Steroidobacteraceae bacterium]
MSTADAYRGKVILITGASSGIGEELAEQLAQRGALLTLAARRADVLTSLAERIAGASHPRPLVIECDVTRDGDVERAVSETVRHRGRLDIAFANAGFGVAGPFAKLSLADYRRQFETNVFGVLRTLYAALPEVTRTKGQLVITGSVAGWVAAPGVSAYAMSKFALRGLANSITPELARQGVAVTLLSPGFIESNIRRVDNRGKLHADAPEPLPPWLVVSRRVAVRQILRAIARRRREAIITGHGRMLVTLERLAPWVMRAIGRRMAARGGGYRAEPV